MQIKAVKFRKGGFYSQPFAFGRASCFMCVYQGFICVLKV